MTIETCRGHIIATLVELGHLDGDRQRALGADAGRDLPFVELEMDSLTALDFCVSLEDAIGKPIEPADLVDHPSVNALARHLAASAPAAN